MDTKKNGKHINLYISKVTLLSMIVSIIAYQSIFNLWVSIGVVVLIFFHEIGHVLAIKKLGYETPPPIFIPFLGAVIAIPKIIKNRNDEAIIGIGGPILGGLSTMIFFFIWYLIDNKQSELAANLLTISQIGFFINFFNLIPINPLDGGHITQAISERSKYFGIIILTLFSLLFQNPLIILVWIIIMSFTKIINVKIQTGISVLAWFAMVYLIIKGYGNENIWINGVYILLGVLLVIFSILKVKMTENIENSNIKRPKLSKYKRIMWLWLAILSYISLTIFLFSMFYLSMLPTVLSQIK